MHSCLFRMVSLRIKYESNSSVSWPYGSRLPILLVKNTNFLGISAPVGIGRKVRIWLKLGINFRGEDER